MSTLAIETRNLSKSFGARAVVDDLSLQLNPGECLAVMGPSGAGKSTLLRLIGGLETPSAGSVLHAGVNVVQSAPQSLSVAMVSQDYSLYPQLTVHKNLQLALRSLKIPHSERENRIATALRELQLLEQADLLPSQLSGGQTQRAAFARALVREPRILLLDEPMSQLDISLRQRQRALLQSIIEKRNTTIVLVTHDAFDAMQLADRVAVMDSGKLIQLDEPKEIYNRPKNLLAAQLLSPFGFNTVELPRILEAGQGRLVGMESQSSRVGFRAEHLSPSVSLSSSDKGLLLKMEVVRSVALGFAHLTTARIDEHYLTFLHAEPLAAATQVQCMVKEQHIIWVAD